jgi:6-phospho-beta-glucosidase
MKIVVIGAGSTYTPELVSGLERERERLDVSELALHDIDPERLEIVGGLASRILARQGFAGQVTLNGDLDRALDGADFVLIQIRVGGQKARLSDETVPLEFDCIGQETTGAGGFSKALRTVPVVLEIAERAAARAAAGAWIVNFTNPVGIVTRALIDAGHRSVGLCNVAITMQRMFARLLEVEPERVKVEQVGLNHLSWVRAVRVDGEDVLAELLSSHADEIAKEIDLPRGLLGKLDVVPSYYLRYYYLHDQVLAEQRGGIPRAVEVAETEHELLALYRDPGLSEAPALLEKRGGAFYSEAAIGLMASLASGSGDVQIVDLRNEGTLTGLADDDVIEVPAWIETRGPVPLRQAPLAPELLGLVQHVAAYERLTARAAIRGDRSLAERALLAHPLIGQMAPAEDLLERLLETGAPYLPKFFPEGRK